MQIVGKSQSFDTFARFQRFDVRIHPGPSTEQRDWNARYPHYNPDTVRLLFRLAFETAQAGHFGTIAIREGGLAQGIAAGFRSGTIQACANHVFSDFDTICSERLAMSQVLQNAPLSAKNKLHPPKIEALILSPRDPDAPEIHQVASCGLCLESMQNTKAITSDTLMIVMARNPESGRPCIDVRPMSSYLPYKSESPQASFTTRPIGDLPLDISRNARAALAHQGLSDLQALAPLVKTALEKAKEMDGVARQKKFSERNNRYLGACALFSPKGEPPRYAQGAALHATNRLFLSADINAVYQGLLKGKEKNALELNDLTLIAYFGRGETHPVRPANLAMLQHLGRRADIVIATIRDDHILLRTIHDYQPIRYIKNKALANPFRQSSDTPGSASPSPV